MKTFQSVKYWIFDLDNTLYSGKTKVFEQVDKKMSKFISQKLNVSVVHRNGLSLPLFTTVQVHSCLFKFFSFRA